MHNLYCCPGWSRPLLLGWLWLLLIYSARAQAPAWDGAITGNSNQTNGTSYTYAAATDASGNVFVTGYFMGTVAFGGTTLTSVGGSQDLFVAKYVPSTGTWAWAQQGGGKMDDLGRGIAVSGTSIYVTGIIHNDLSNTEGVLFGSTTQVNGASPADNSDIILAKYTDAGNSATLIWTQVGGGTAADISRGVAVNGTSIYVTGILHNSSDNTNKVLFGGSGTTMGTSQVNGAATPASDDLVLVKYTDNGTSATLGWTQVGGGSGPDNSFGVAVSGVSVYITGNIYTTVSNSRSVVFGGGGTVAGTMQVNGTSNQEGEDLVLAKYTDAGSSASLGWTQVGGGSSRDVGFGVVASGNRVYVTGVISNNVNNDTRVVFGSSGTTPGTTQVNGTSPRAGGDIILAKYTDGGSSATLGWTQVAGGTYSEAGYGVTISNNNIYVAGTVYNASDSNVVFGGNGTQPGTSPVSGASDTDSDDLVLAKYTDNGNTGGYVWSRTGGGARFDYGYGVVVSGQRVFAAGFATPTATFGPTTFTAPRGFAINLLAQITDITLTPLATRAGGPVGGKVMLYPNPAPAGAARLAGLQPGQTVQILNPLGQVLASAFASREGVVPIGLALQPGLYIVRTEDWVGHLTVE
jgi:hypothetical protein